MDAIPFEDRNTLIQCLTNPEWRRRLPDWEVDLPRLIAEPAWKNLVKRLRQESELFERMWKEHDVSGERIVLKRYLHPDVGLLRFEFSYLYLGRRSEISLATLTPADEETAAKLPSSF
ncbi:MmyB family transcriptional regulator [Amycolatopsis lurida]